MRWKRNAQVCLFRRCSKSQYSWEVTSLLMGFINPDEKPGYSLEGELAALGLIPPNLRGCLCCAGPALSAHNRRVVVFAVDQGRSHIVVAVATDCVLRPSAAEAADDGGLLRLARLLQLLRLELRARERLHGAAAANLGHLDGRHLLLGLLRRVSPVQRIARGELIRGGGRALRR